MSYPVDFDGDYEIHRELRLKTEDLLILAEENQCDATCSPDILVVDGEAICLGCERPVVLAIQQEGSDGTD